MGNAAGTAPKCSTETEIDRPVINPTKKLCECGFNSPEKAGSLMVQMKGRFRTSCLQQHKVSDWHLQRVYSPGACVFDRENPEGGFSLCMKEHATSLDNRPTGAPFRGLMVETFRELEQALVLAGILDKKVAAIVCDYLPSSDVWWPLCKNREGVQDPYTGCGNVATLGSPFCQRCLLKDTPTHLGLGQSSLTIECNPTPELLEKAVVLLQRTFHSNVSDLISSCAAKSSFEKLDLKTCRTWCVLHPQQGLIGALLWRCVCTKGSGTFGIRMLEVLFLATREDMAQTKVGEEVVGRLLTYAQAQTFDVVSVAAVPAQGIAFWSKNGFTHYPDPKSTATPANYYKETKDLTLDPAKATQISTFLHHHMLIFPDTPLFARVL